ncbi:MAG: ATPase [Treponema sp.]|jgi:hypothetical protein|nr:ATPase [Treponema sp.]
MEELQSTETLDREILEDARKKAYRILKTADDAVKAGAAAWEKKSAEAAAELENRYRARRRRSLAEISARLPLDKQRLWSEYVEKLLDSAAADWFAGLDREQVLALLGKELEKRLAECPEFAAAGTIGVTRRGLEKAEAETAVKKQLPHARLVFEDSPAGEGLYPELTLDIPAVRITASINILVDSLLHDKRAELAAALLGPGGLSGPDRAGGNGISEGVRGA